MCRWWGTMLATLRRCLRQAMTLLYETLRERYRRRIIHTWIGVMPRQNSYANGEFKISLVLVLG
ncbi:MAG: hypothetical protein V7K41_01280 [Nostoc sp.]|uniref:hypothetical protein n=1 Tax=Nostoc sp. TaxID=1180 RepID=UPI002FF5FF45